MKQILGRYASVIITTIVFLALVISVLGINFYLSFQTEANAEVVNLAGRQRMLSQRVAKSLNNLKIKIQAQQPIESARAELASASGIFDKTLLAFKSGGETKSTKTGQTLLDAVSGTDGVKAVDEALTLWRPLQQNISKILTEMELSSGAGTPAVDAAINSAIEYTDANINTILKLMNNLTNHTESIANDAADRSRLIQTVGILLSLVCFAIILYLIFGQLRISDRVAETAKEETQRIFETVTQGLFLVDSEGNTGSQRSKALDTIFGRAPDDNQSFLEFIRPLVTDDDVSKVERYLALLFDPHKKQRLLKDLNPLNQLSVQVEEKGQVKSKFLNFSFARVVQEGEIVSVLISVFDVSKEVKLERELESEAKRNQQQLEMVRVLLSADNSLLPEFLANSKNSCNEINNILRSPAQNPQEFRDKAKDIHEHVHKIKGESAAMGLNFVSQQCHEFEDEVDRLSKLTSISGDDFLSLTVMLERLINTNEQIDSVFDIVNNQQTSKTQSAASANQDNVNQAFVEMVRATTSRQGKRVDLSLAGFDNTAIPAETKINLVSMASQLLRNALTHGIEPSTVRQQQGKNETGNVSLTLYDEQERGLKLICEDDGQGFDFDAIADKAIKSGLLSEALRAQITPNQVLSLVMRNRLSSKDDADQDAGRGVGLNVVSEIASRMGAKVSLQSRNNKGSRFTVRLPAISAPASTEHALELANG